MPLYAAYLDTHRPLDSERQVQLFGSKFIKGLDPADAAVPLEVMLFEPWPTDLHFSQYTCPTGIRCVKTAPVPEGIRFDIAAFDADFNGHKTKPTIEDFERLCRSCYVLDEPPNWLYQTRGGARLIYEIAPIWDPDEFERHYQKFLTRITAAIANGTSGYEIDGATKDWTRLFRAPLVTRDDAEEYDRIVGRMIAPPLDLRTFKAAPKTKPAPPTRNRNFTGNDRVLNAADLSPGNRNNELFSKACYALKKYKPEAAEQWLEVLTDKAIASGLGQREIDTIFNSARRTTGAKQ